MAEQIKAVEKYWPLARIKKHLIKGSPQRTVGEQRFFAAAEQRKYNGKC